jgi:hypothetical protein
MLRIGVLIGLAIATTNFASAQGGLTLTIGRLAYSGSYIHQNVSVKNETSNLVRLVEVECGFFHTDELIATASALIENIAPNGKGFKTILEGSDISPDRAECRIVSSR